MQNVMLARGFLQSYTIDKLRKIKGNVSELSEYVKKATYNHEKYYHYTSVDSALNILDSGELWLSDISSDFSNDKVEAAKAKASEHFAISFSHELTDNLAMWYLYSGEDQLGVRIGLENGDFRRIFIKKNFDLYVRDADDGVQVKVVDINDWETHANDWDIRVQDVLYRQDLGSAVSGKVLFYYEEVQNVDFSISDWTDFEKDNRFFIKQSIWKNELETKVIISPNSYETKKIFKEGHHYQLVVKPSYNDGKCLKDFVHVCPGPETGNDIQNLFTKMSDRVGISEYSQCINMRRKQRMSAHSDIKDKRIDSGLDIDVVSDGITVRIHGNATPETIKAVFMHLKEIKD